MSPPKKPAKKTAAKTATKTVRKKAPARTVQPNSELEELKFVVDSAWERRTMLTIDEIEGSTRPIV